MFKEISNTLGSAMPYAGAACYASALFVGRKFCLAAGYKVASFVAELMEKENVAEWEKTSQFYWAMAKKDAVRDLTAAGGFIALGLLSVPLREALLVKEEKKPE